MIRHICQSNSCWLTSGKMHCKSSSSVCLGFWYKGGCCGDFSVAVKLFSLQTGSFSLVLTHWRRVSFGKTKPSTPPFPFLSQSNPLYVGNTIWMARIIRMHPETAFVVSWYFFFLLIKFIWPQNTSLLKLNFCKRFQLYQLSYHRIPKPLFLKYFFKCYVGYFFFKPTAIKMPCFTVTTAVAVIRMYFKYSGMKMVSPFARYIFFVRCVMAMTVQKEAWWFIIYSLPSTSSDI